MAKGALHTVGRSSRGAQRERSAVCVRGHRGRYLGRRISACSNLTTTAGHGGLHLLPPYPSVPHPGASRLRSAGRSEEHTSELQSRQYLVCRLLLEKKKKKKSTHI